MVEISNQNIFINAILSDIENYPGKSHFLLSALNKDRTSLRSYITDCDLSLPIINKVNSKQAVTMCLKKAIQDVYRIFDSEMYLNFTVKENIVSSLVWGKFRKYHKDWMSIYSNKISFDNIQKQERYKKMKMDASNNQSNRLQNLKLQLGNGDIEKGEQLFNIKKQVDMSVANNTIKDVSLNHRIKFTAWLASQSGILHMNPFLDKTVKTFDNVSQYIMGSDSIHKTFYVPTSNDLLLLLYGLSTHTEAYKLSILSTIVFNSNIAYEYPHTFVYISTYGDENNTLLSLRGTQSVSSGFIFNIIGIVKHDEKFYGVSDKTECVFKQLPDEFHSSFRGENPSMRVPTSCRVLRPLRNISCLTIFNKTNDCYYNFRIKENINPVCINTIISEIFMNTFLHQSITDSNNRLDILRKEKFLIKKTRLDTLDEKLSRLTNMFISGKISENVYNLSTEHMKKEFK